MLQTISPVCAGWDGPKGLQLAGTTTRRERRRSVMSKWPDAVRVKGEKPVQDRLAKPEETAMPEPHVLMTGLVIGESRALARGPVVVLELGRPGDPRRRRRGQERGDGPCPDHDPVLHRLAARRSPARRLRARRAAAPPGTGRVARRARRPERPRRQQPERDRRGRPRQHLRQRRLRLRPGRGHCPGRHRGHHPRRRRCARLPIESPSPTAWR